MPELHCASVSAGYGKRDVLADLDLRVPAGTLTAILGASGSGKSTLLRAIAGFVSLSRGEVRIGGAVVATADGVQLPPEKRRIGYVAQEGALYPHLSVSQNIGFGLSRPERRSGQRIAETLELVGLDRSYEARSPHELSGGEQRRVALARALAPRPRLVLLDEPFSGLDAALRAGTRQAVLHALAAEGATALLVTHDQAEAFSTGREVGVLRAGRLVQIAPPAELYRMPRDLDIAGFVGDAVTLPGHVLGGIAVCALGSLQVLNPGYEGAVQVMVRPEQIRLDGWQPGGVPAAVVGLIFQGSDALLRLRLRAGGEIVTARVFGLDAAEVGDLVRLEVTGAVMVYREPLPTSPGVSADAAACHSVDAS